MTLPEIRAAMLASRHTAGLRQADVAEAMGTHPPCVSRLEHGPGGLRVSSVIAYLVATGHTLAVVPVDAGEPNDGAPRPGRTA